MEDVGLLVSQGGGPEGPDPDTILLSPVGANMRLRRIKGEARVSQQALCKNIEIY